MAKVKLDVPLMNLKGSAPLKREGDDLTMQQIIAESLVLHDPNERIDGTEKAKRFLLAMRVQKEVDPELKSGDIELIKKVIGAFQGPLVVGQVFEVLDKV